MVQFPCKECPGNEALRRDFGCDGPTEKPFAAIECQECGGGEASCWLCHGHPDGVQLSRCPRAEATQQAKDICRIASLVPLGVLPSAGGICDQAATFVDAVPIILREKRHYDDARNKREAPRAEG